MVQIQSPLIFQIIKNDLPKQVVLLLVYTLDAAFFHSRYLKNFEKAATFVRKFRH
jgi:hypothetical protein